jgi:hypothetical protein
MVGFLGSFHQRSRVAHFFRSRGHVSSHSWLPSHAGQATAADEWAWSPLAVSEVSCGLDNEEVEALSMPRTIPGVGLK